MATRTGSTQLPLPGGRVTTPGAHSAHPIVFLILYLPFGIAAGYVIVTLAYLLSRAGLSVAQVAGVVALMFLPQTWKVLWAPIVDMTLTTRRWYLIAAALTGALILAMACVPARAAQLWLLDVLGLMLSVAYSVAGMATESLMAHATAEHQKGRAGGWCQAGGLGGQGLGGGAGLWMAQHVAPWSAGVLLGATCLLCCGALWAVPRQSQTAAPAPGTQVPGTLRYGARLLEVGNDVWAVARSRGGFLAGLLVFLPIGTAAASNLWSAVAGDWHASADTVALVNGVLSGLIAAAGCLVGGYLCDVMDRKAGYALYGLALAACAVAMGLAPRTPTTFMVFVCLYAFVSGCAYAAFTGVALETIGKGAAATKYNVLACLANIPITYMTVVDGAARTRLGPAGMLFLEAALAVLAVLVFGGVAAATRRRWPAAASMA